MSALPSWQAILPPPLAAQALAVAEEIAAALSPFRTAPGRRPEAEVSLAHGRTGAALFFAYLDRALPERGYGERALELLDESLEKLGSSAVGTSLYGGFSGVAWVVEHFRGWLIDDDPEDPGEEAIVALREVLDRTPWEGEFDLLGGLAGLGVYALERGPRSGARECLEKVIGHLAETACRHGGGAAWKTRADLMPEDRPDLPGEHFNLGMAHGNPGVVACLAEALAAGLDVRPLLAESVAWLLRQRLPPGSVSAYPYYVPPRSAPIGARLAWCYGDPGVAVALFKAGRAAAEPSWREAALALARGAARRREEEAAEVRDATLCHGTAGLAHIFNRLYQGTGDPLLGEAALHWARRTLEMRRPGEGIAGFRTWDVDPELKIGWRSDSGFLTGLAGIGLGLLAAATAVEPAWDRVMLTSCPVADAPRRTEP